MTDFYSKMCETISCSGEHGLLLANMLQVHDDLIAGRDPFVELPEIPLKLIKDLITDDSYTIGAETDVDNDGITITLDETNEEAFCKVIRAWSIVVDRIEPVAFEMAHTVSKDTVGGYGGSATVVTQYGYRSIGTHELVVAFRERGLDAALGVAFIAHKMYARPVVPYWVESDEYAGPEGQYTPWIICHHNPDALSNEDLDIHWKVFVEQGGDTEEFENFIEYLYERGYQTLHTEAAGVWQPSR